MVRRKGPHDKPRSQNPFLAALDRLLAEAARYRSTAYPHDDDLARLHSAVVEVQLVEPAGVTIPPLIREHWPLYEAEHGPVSNDGGKTWVQEPHYWTVQVGNHAAWQRWVREIEGIAEAVRRQKADDAPSAVKPSRKRRHRKPQPLTARQTEIVQVVSDHKGDIAAAAGQLGISRQAVEKHYGKAMKKLGRAAAKLPRPATQRLSEDRRGQCNIGKKDEES